MLIIAARNEGKVQVSEYSCPSALIYAEYWAVLRFDRYGGDCLVGSLDLFTDYFRVQFGVQFCFNSQPWRTTRWSL
jgi:hypothetical protein